MLQNDNKYKLISNTYANYLVLECQKRVQRDPNFDKHIINKLNKIFIETIKKNKR